MPTFGGWTMLGPRFDLRNAPMLGEGFRRSAECPTESFSERVVSGALDHGTPSLRG